MANIRSPSQLMDLFLQHESKDTFDEFVKSLSYEEVTMIMMVIELMLKNPSITSHKSQTLEQALEFFGGIRKTYIENN